MAAELQDVQEEIVALRRELGLPAQGHAPSSIPQATPAAANLLPRTLTEEERQLQAAVALSKGSQAAAGGAPGSATELPPGRIKIKRQVSGIDGMRTMPPQNPHGRPGRGPAVHAADVEEVGERDEDDDEDEDDEEDWAPLTRQVSGRRGMQMTEVGPSAHTSLLQATPAAANLLPRTLTEEERQLQAAVALSKASQAAPGPPRQINIKRQVSGIDGMRTMPPQNPHGRPDRAPAAHAAAVEEVGERDEDDAEEDDDEQDWAPLTRQVSGRRGMQMAAFHR